jgi:hypothetical protein
MKNSMVKCKNCLPILMVMLTAFLAGCSNNSEKVLDLSVLSPAKAQLPDPPPALEHCYRETVAPRDNSANGLVASKVATDGLKTKCLQEWPRWYRSVQAANGGAKQGRNRMSDTIIPGIDWAQSFRVVANSGTPFPSGVQIKSHFREVISGELLTELSTDGGGIVRVSNSIIEMKIAGTVTKNWTMKTVYFDWVITSADPDEYGDFVFKIDVYRPITRL